MEDDKEGEEKTEEGVAIDWRKTIPFFKKHGILFLILIPLFFSVSLRIQPEYLPIADVWAEKFVLDVIRSHVKGSIDQQYPDVPQRTKETFASKEFQKIMEQQKSLIDLEVRKKSNEFRSRMKDNKDNTYLLAIDSYFWMRHSRNVVEKGHPGDEIRGGKPYDTFMFAPSGREVPPDMFHAYFTGALYRIFRLFNPGIDLMVFIFYIPILISSLAILPAFFIARKFSGNIGGFFAAMLVAVHPAFMMRSMGGFSDTDPYNVTLPLYITWLFLEAFESKSVMKKVILAIASGFLVGIYSFTWSGWWYVFDFLLIAGAVYFAYTIIINWNILRKGVGNLFRQAAVRNTLIIMIVFFLFSSLFTILFIGFKMYNLAITGPLGFTQLKEAGTVSLFPNVYKTVAEQTGLTLREVIELMGGNLLFVLSMFGALFTLVRRDEKGKMDVKYAILLILWIISTTYASMKGIRYSLLMVPAFSIGFGIFVGVVYKQVGMWLSKELKIEKTITRIVLLALLALLIISPIRAGHNAAIIEYPNMNDAWYSSLKKIDNEAEPDAIITSWWDFGHWFKMIGNRRVTFDGTSQNSPQAHWIGKVLADNNERSAVGILRMMDCSGYRGGTESYDVIFNVTLDAPEAIDVIYEIVQLDKEGAKEALLSRGFNDEKADEVLGHTHCDAPEAYFITSEDMIKKSSVWAHFGSWNFVKASMYNKVRGKEYGEGKKILIEEFNMSDKDADTRYYEIESVTDAPLWISPLISYAPGSGECSIKEDKISCTIGIPRGALVINIDMMTHETTIQTAQGDKHPDTLVYADEDGLHEKEFTENTIGLSAALIPTREGYSIRLMDQKIAMSTFTRLFFYRGHGSECFEEFSHDKSVLGDVISVWKVDWECKQSTLMPGFRPKTTVSDGDTASVNYIGWDENGNIFDSSIQNWQELGITKETEFSDDYEYRQFSFKTGAGEAISGFDKGVTGMKKGEEKIIEIPPEKGYGTDPAAHPLGGKTLYFRIRVESIE